MGVCESGKKKKSSSMGSSSREIQCTAIRYGCPGLFQKGPPKTTRINRFFFFSLCILSFCCGMAEGKFRLTTSEWPLLERKKVKWNTMCLPVRKKPSSHFKKKRWRRKKNYWSGGGGDWNCPVGEKELGQLITWLTVHTGPRVNGRLLLGLTRQSPPSLSLSLLAI